MRIAATFAALTAATLCVGVLAGCTSSNDVSDGAAERIATWECQDAVSAQLKSPSTAEFSDQAANGDKSQGWLVRGHVDAQNSFGATVRSAWTCKAKWDTESNYIGSAEVIFLNQF